MNDSSEIVKVVFAGGGTGGHIYPGLAVADSLRSLCDKNGKKIQIYWIGNSKGMDRSIVEKNVDGNGIRSADFFYGIPRKASTLSVASEFSGSFQNFCRFYCFLFYSS